MSKPETPCYVFPHSELTYDVLPDGSYKSGTLHSPGMTLRDYFAGRALTGMAQSTRLRVSAQWFAERAREAYALADAMLAEREKGQ